MTDQWTEEVRSALNIDEDVDVDRLLKLARLSAHRVERKAAPITTFLVGLAAGKAGGGTAEFDRMATVVEEMVMARPEAAD